jgi:hypothetical protein
VPLRRSHKSVLFACCLLSLSACSSIETGYVQRALAAGPRPRVDGRNVSLAWSNPAAADGCVLVGTVATAGLVQDIARDDFAALKSAAGQEGANRIVIKDTGGRDVEEGTFRSMLYDVDTRLTVYAAAFACGNQTSSGPLKAPPAPPAPPPATPPATPPGL